MSQVVVGNYTGFHSTVQRVGLEIRTTVDSINVPILYQGPISSVYSYRCYTHISREHFTFDELICLLLGVSKTCNVYSGRYVFVGTTFTEVHGSCISCVIYRKGTHLSFFFFISKVQTVRYIVKVTYI